MRTPKKSFNLLSRSTASSGVRTDCTFGSRSNSAFNDRRTSLFDLSTGFTLKKDADERNGCMWAEPGGHRRPLHRRFVRDGRRTWMETLDATPLPEDGLVPLCAPKGTLVLLHGQLPHRSGPNPSTRSRHAYALHLIDGACRLSLDNWLRRAPDMPLRGF